MFAGPARGILVLMIQPVVICPLQLERRLIRKPVGLRAKIIVSGPGADAVRAAVRELKADPPPLVILCGVAGGLLETAVAPRIVKILDRNARSWTAPVVVPGDEPGVTVLALDEPVETVERKSALSRAYAAALVDCESHAFAEEATALGLRWGVVRGVSDGPGESLPAGVGEWVDDRGRARIGRFLGHCILEPAAFFAALRLRKRSRAAMKAAAARLVELLNIEKQNATDLEAALGAKKKPAITTGPAARPQPGPKAGATAAPRRP